MKIGKLYWSNLGISKKFRLAFTVLLTLIIMIAATSYISFLYIRSAEQDIRRSSEIGQLVLEMDRGMEKARRLHGDFFLHFPNIGLQKAHERYAQPSVRQIAHVISISRDLQKILFQPEVRNLSNISQVDFNLYLASAKRFAKTSIEAVELIAMRAAPERGLEAQLKAISMDLGDELKGFPLLEKRYKLACSFYKDYLISRQRFLMQSAFNNMDKLRHAADQETRLSSERKNTIFSLLDSCHILAAQLLDVDLSIKGKWHDFSLQEQAVTPISNAMIEAVRIEVALAEQRIDQAHQITSLIILSISLLGIFAMLNIAKLLNTSVTRRILTLTESAKEISKGNLDVRVREGSQDELGQLASIFNTTVSKLKDLVENLEKKVEERTAELSESEMRFRHLANDLPKMAVQGYDSERKIIFWNRASEAIYGYREDEALGRKLEDLIIPESMREGVVNAIHNWLENDVPIPSSELTLQGKNGKAVSVFSSHVMLVGNQGDKTLYCIDMDLADLKRAQEKGERSESLYRQLFDHSSSGVAVYEAVDDGRDFIFRDFNKAGEEIEGVKCQELLGRRLTEVFPGVKEFGLLDVLRKVWQTGEPAHHPLSYYTDGRLQGWRDNRVYRLPSGEVVSIYDDVTRQKQIEEEKQTMEERLRQAQKMEAIGTLAGGIAHDFNNILSAIIGYSQLIEKEVPTGSNVAKDVAHVLESGKRGADLVKQILTFSRKTDTEKQPLRPHLVVKEALKMLRATLPTTILIEEHIDPDCGLILADPTNIHQITVNLCTNGLHAMTEGKGTLSISLHRQELCAAELDGDAVLSPGSFVVLSVSDTGCGMDQATIDRIFEPYFTTKEVGRGTGLGLAVIHGIVQDAKGFIRVKSTPGEGSSFDIFFPMLQEDTFAAQEPVQRVSTQEGNEQILVVDDEPLLVRITQRQLENFGYRVTTTTKSNDALEKIRAAPKQFDLLITDQTMPGLTGAELALAVKEIRPDLPVILCTGHSDQVSREKALALGIKKYIPKPIVGDELVNAVRSVLNGK